MKVLKILFVFLIYLLLSVTPTARVASTAHSQCAMCKKNLEAGMKAKDETKRVVGSGINEGILFLLAFPYLAFGIVGGLWYYNRRKAKHQINIVSNYN